MLRIGKLRSLSLINEKGSPRLEGREPSRVCPYTFCANKVRSSIPLSWGWNRQFMWIPLRRSSGRHPTQPLLYVVLLYGVRRTRGKQSEEGRVEPGRVQIWEEGSVCRTERTERLTGRFWNR